MPRTAALLAAATADARTGAARDDSALVGRLTDPQRAGAETAGALREVRARIRQHAR